MEPAEPILKYSFKKSFNINSDKNHIFILNIENLITTIEFTTYYKDNYIQHNYEKKFNLDELKKNIYLGLCETIDEMYEQIIILFEKNQTQIIEDTNQISIIIPVEHIKIKEIVFVVNEKSKNDSEKIDELYNIISTLNIEILNLKEENKKIKEENISLKEKMQEFLLYIPDLKEIKAILDTEKILNLDSKIIEDNINYNKTLKNWINPNKKIKSELLYRMSRDGIEYSTFHKLCDNKGPTIILVKLIDGDILGIYTPLDWDINGNWKSDLDMFAFSLTENNKSNKNYENNYGILCKSNFGPFSLFLQFNNKFKMDITYIFGGNSGFLDCDKLFSREQDYYDNSEVEVHKIIFD
jgi:hypothetical protein